MAIERELDNANPTILEIDELPTRQRKRNTAARKPIWAKKEPASDLSPFWLDSNAETGDSDSATDDVDAGDPIDEQEIYDLISTISDPEHPLTLGQLAVVNLPDIHLDPPPVPGKGPDLNTLTTVSVMCTPTINHCSLATIIGLAVRVRLEFALPPNYRVDVTMKDGSHAQDDQVNKQLGDKERVAAALENDTLKRTLDAMMATCQAQG